MDSDGRWTKEDIPKLREIKKDQKQVEKLKKEKKWCDPDQYELLLQCSENLDAYKWNEYWLEDEYKIKWLQNTTFVICNFENAELGFCNFENSTFIDVVFTDCDLRGTRIANTVFKRCKLDNVFLWLSNFENCCFQECKLNNADMTFCNIVNSDFRDSEIYGSDFRKSDIRGSNFSHIKMGSLGFFTELYHLKDGYKKIDHKPHESTDFGEVNYNAKNYLSKWLLNCLLWILWFIIFRMTLLYKVKLIPIFRFVKIFSFPIPCKKRINIGLPWFGKFKNIGIYSFPQRTHYLQTTFIGVDTTNVDWSKNPQLKRDIHNQQYLHDLKSRIRQKSLLIRVPQWILYFLWWVTSDCGDSILRWMFWSGVFAVFFAGLFAGWFTYEKGVCEQPKLHYQTYDLIQENETGVKDTNTIDEPDFGVCLYYSVVTFTTLGFGDVVPVNDSGRIAVMIEVILGYIMLGGLISLFANKFVRRE